jgi:hypothetical protein
MTEQEARQRIADVFAKYVQPHCPSTELEEAELLDEKPMALEAGVDGHGVLISVIERSPDDETVCHSIAASQPDSIAVGEFYVLISIDHEDLGYDKARAICSSVKEPGIFFRHMEDNEEMTPSEFLEALKQWEEEAEE